MRRSPVDSTKRDPARFLKVATHSLNGKARSWSSYCPAALDRPVCALPSPRTIQKSNLSASTTQLTPDFLSGKSEAF